MKPRLWVHVKYIIYIAFFASKLGTITLTKLVEHCRHEITGVITKVGANVRNFKVGDRVGVGCLAASCLNCEHCDQSEENYCEQAQFTYNGIFWDGSVTYGGYSEMLVADKR